MNAKNAQNISKLVIIVGLAALVLFMIHSCNKDVSNDNNNSNEAPVPSVSENFMNQAYDSDEEEIEGFYSDGENVVNDPADSAEGTNYDAVNNSEDEVNASESEEVGNATFQSVENQEQNDENENENNNLNRLPSECYPKDVLTPQDLLPGDSNSTWAQTVPAGQGSLGDQNFLNAGFHVGINTVGQSLRNANLQLRSEPPNPQVKVSPWLQTTIDPDVNRRALEIGA